MMKTKLTASLFLLFLINITPVAFAQNIGINGTGANAHASALLDVDATATPSLGLLIPRIALQAINLSTPVTSPANSLLVFNTASASTGTNAVSSGYYYWDAISLKWVRFAQSASGSSSTAWDLLGNTGTNPITNFIGTTDAQDLVLRTNGVENLRVFNSTGNLSIGTNTNSGYKTEITKTNGGSLLRLVNTATVVAAHNWTGLIHFDDGLTRAGYIGDGSSANKAMQVIGANAYGVMLASFQGTNNAAENARIDLLPGGDSRIDFRTKNTQRMTIDSLGMVGIGTYTPNGALHIRTAIDAGINSSGDGASLVVGNYHALHLEMDDNEIAVMTGSVSSILSLNTGGKTFADTIGIGTASPTEKLHVQGNVRFSGALMPNNISGTIGQILMSAGVGLAPTWGSIATPTNAWNINGNAGTNATTNFIGTTDNIPLNFRVNNATAGKIEFGSYGNTFLGHLAGQNVNLGRGCVAIGQGALTSNVLGLLNIAIGYNSQTATTGSWNDAMGFGALSANTTGGGNTSIGHLSGGNNITGSNNTYLGYYADASNGSSNLSNSSAIGYDTKVNASNKVRIGSATVSVIEGQVAYSFPSDGRFKTITNNEVMGLDFITKLRPVTYTFDTKKFDEFLMKNMPDSTKQKRMAGNNYTQSSNVIHTGFIAQEVEKIAKETGFVFDGIHSPENENDNYSVAYSQFVVPLVKAVQELNAEKIKQQQQIEDLKKQNLEILQLLKKN